MITVFRQGKVAVGHAVVQGRRVARNTIVKRPINENSLYDDEQHHEKCLKKPDDRQNEEMHDPDEDNSNLQPQYKTGTT
jgi:hypothetical protein